MFISNFIKILSSSVLPAIGKEDRKKECRIDYPEEGVDKLQKDFCSFHGVTFKV